MKFGMAVHTDPNKILSTNSKLLIDIQIDSFYALYSWIKFSHLLFCKWWLLQERETEANFV